jgi:uncharacterized repeat protein (TIGR01451 family)
MVGFQNPGTAPATNVEIVAYLPKGLEFMSADNKGQYDTRQHAVHWSLAELPASKSGFVQIEAFPIDVGEQIVRAEAKADLNLAADAEHTTVVQSVTELEFSVADLQDPIEVGSETTYEIRVLNNGGKRATGIQVAALLSAGIQALKGEGTTAVTISPPGPDGQLVEMAAIAELPPRGEAIYRLKVKGVTEGYQLIRVQLQSSDAATPITKEEGTKVYLDYEPNGPR